MKVIDHTTYKEILPDDGKVLTDGNGWTTAVSVPPSADISRWHDIDKPAEGEPIEDSEALAIITGGTA